MAAKSKRFQLGNQDLVKIATGAAIAALGGVSTYIATQVMPSLEGESEWTVLLFVVCSTSVNALRKWLEGPAEK